MLNNVSLDASEGNSKQLDFLYLFQAEEYYVKKSRVISDQINISYKFHLLLYLVYIYLCSQIPKKENYTH